MSTSFCGKLFEAIKVQDFFARQVTFTFRGRSSYKSFVGGCITILVVLTITIGALIRLHSLIADPEFINYPEKLNFESKQKFELDTQTNMVSLMIKDNYEKQKFINKNLRIVFFKDRIPKIVPAVYCTDLFAD